jgi:hypothetical protein
MSRNLKAESKRYFTFDSTVSEQVDYININNPDYDPSKPISPDNEQFLINPNYNPDLPEGPGNRKYQTKSLSYRINFPVDFVASPNV